MIIQRSLSDLSWTLLGDPPTQIDVLLPDNVAVSEVPEIPARVPGSVQAALFDAGMLPDWNVGLNFYACEWVENRHWQFRTTIPADWTRGQASVRLRCPALDYCGEIRLNGRLVGTFENAHIEHVFDLKPHLADGDNKLVILFTCPPRWVGGASGSSRIKDWKPRFNFTWDWTARLVQIGIPLAPVIETGDGASLGAVDIFSEGKDALRIEAASTHPLHATLLNGGRVVAEADFTGSLRWDNLDVKPWWPNGEGDQPLYTLRVSLPGHETREWKIGFRSIDWKSCRNAPPGADPWLCEINGRPVFLQGVNWTPIRPNFADVPDATYRELLTTYRDLGANTLRVWGGFGFERPLFYDLCDELGLLVWQEFPLSSSGFDNWPPEDPVVVQGMSQIAADIIPRLRHHASLLVWCGGNELQGSLDGGKTGIGKPVDNTHPMMAMMAESIQRLDAGRRFLPSSSSGPRFLADEKEYGLGVHWDVHGPWREESEGYWNADDSLFRSETGAPGASPLDILQATVGEFALLPANASNPIWRRTAAWLQWDEFLKEHGREPLDIGEFVAWSQATQARALQRAVRACKRRFPECGGVLLWMGHDSFPCTANTSIIDFRGRPKPAALAVGAVWREKAG